MRNCGSNAVFSTLPGGAVLKTELAMAHAVTQESGRGRADCVVILGATSAIARALAVEYARDGHKLILAARDDAHAAAIAADLKVRFGADAVPVHFDASAFDQHAQVFDEILGHAQDRLAGVIVCFGYMESQARAQAQAAVARRTLDVNLTAAVCMLERFAQALEESQSGFIAAVSSVAGDRGRQSNYIYGAAKAGLSVYLQGLRNRLHGAGVAVITIKPGFIDTQMTFGLPGLFLVASPEKAARAIVRGIRRQQSVVYVPFFWRYIMAAIKAVPEWQFKRMKL
jgi:decaprenylphospho-beta-D-erythro-pentofuranosid-2-ulose 2-reductase